MVTPKGKQCRVVAIGGTHYDTIESIYTHYIVVDIENTTNNSDHRSVIEQREVGSIIQ
jgi:hypothetical protein